MVCSCILDQLLGFDGTQGKTWQELIQSQDIKGLKKHLNSLHGKKWLDQMDVCMCQVTNMTKE